MLMIEKNSYHNTLENPQDYQTRYVALRSRKTKKKNQTETNRFEGLAPIEWVAIFHTFYQIHFLHDFAPNSWLRILCISSASALKYMLICFVYFFPSIIQHRTELQNAGLAVCELIRSPGRLRSVEPGVQLWWIFFHFSVKIKSNSTSDLFC